MLSANGMVAIIINDKIAPDMTPNLTTVFFIDLSSGRER